MSDSIDDMIEELRAQMEYELAPGVQGWTRNRGLHTIEIASIRAEHEGNGDVGRYLDALPKDRTVMVPLVTSDRLAGMLRRRGYKEGYAYLELAGINAPQWCHAWIRKATNA